MNTLAIDPGKRQGWAILEDQTLIACGEGTAPRLPANRPYDLVIVERPHCGYGRASAADIIVLAMRAQKALDSVAFRQYQMVSPSTWKGSVPKEIMAYRIRAALSMREFSLLPARLQKEKLPKAVDVLDAIGLGFWAVGRSLIPATIVPKG